MKNRVARVIVIGMASVAMLAAQGNAMAADAAPEAGNDPKPMIDAMAAIGAIIAGADKTAAAEESAVGANVVEEESTAAKPAVTAAEGEPAPVAKRRSAKNSVILVTAGAAAGAALGQTLGKDPKAAMIGAALGGAVGLIYDRMTYKNPGKI